MTHCIIKENYGEVGTFIRVQLIPGPTIRKCTLHHIYSNSPMSDYGSMQNGSIFHYFKLL